MGGRQAGDRRCSRSIWRTDTVWQWIILPNTGRLLAHGDVGKVQSWRVTFKAEEAKTKVEQIQRNKDQLVLVPDDGEWWEEAKLRCREETDSFLKMGKRTWSSEVIQSRTQSLKVVGTSFYTHSITFTLL